MMLLVMMTMGGSYPVVKGQEDFNSTFFAPDITSNAEIICPDSSNDTFNIVLLGETGVGKSTFGNYLLGVQPSEGFKVNQWRQPIIVVRGKICCKTSRLGTPILGRKGILISFYFDADR